MHICDNLNWHGRRDRQHAYRHSKLSTTIEILQRMLSALPTEKDVLELDDTWGLRANLAFEDIYELSDAESAARSTASRHFRSQVWALYGSKADAKARFLTMRKVLLKEPLESLDEIAFAKADIESFMGRTRTYGHADDGGLP